MYLFHLLIIIFYFVMLLCCIKTEIPKNLKADSIYMHPFYKLAGGYLHIKKHFSTPKNNFKNRAVKDKLSILNPYENSRLLLREYRLRVIGKSFMLIFCGNLLCLFICISGFSSSNTLNGTTLTRNDYGLGEKKINVDIYSDDKLLLKEEPVTISDKRYTKEELEIFYNNLCQQIDTLILGKNQSLDVVCYDLNFPDSIAGYPFKLEWKVDDYSAINKAGELDTTSLSPEGKLINLTVIMTYYDFQNEFTLPAHLYKLPENSRDGYISKLRELISSYENQTVSMNYSLLPTELDGNTLTYKQPANYDSLVILCILLFITIFVSKADENDLDKDINKRRQQMMLDYPQIVSKLQLLVGAGMTISAAFEKIGQDYEKRNRKKEQRFAYEEILLCVRQIQGGKSEADAYIYFGNRCGLQKYSKLGASLAQNIKKGSGHLLETLELEENDAFEERKAYAKKMGEEAGTKLLLPMIMMLIIVMVIVIVPAFLSL